MRGRVTVSNPSPELSMTFVEAPYLVTGTTVAQWLESMALLGPWRNGARQSAHTDWQVRWSYVPAKRPAGFVVAAARVRLLVETMLPVWLPPRTASPETIASLQDATRRIERHERGHLEIGVAAARALIPALCELQPADALERLHERAAAATGSVIAAFRRRDDEWDQEEALAFARAGGPCGESMSGR
jgi:predicted secreted Zn-dependent protease